MTSQVTRHMYKKRTKVSWNKDRIWHKNMEHFERTKNNKGKKQIKDSHFMFFKKGKQWQLHKRSCSLDSKQFKFQCLWDQRLSCIQSKCIKLPFVYPYNVGTYYYPAPQNIFLWSFQNKDKAKQILIYVNFHAVDNFNLRAGMQKWISIVNE